VSVAKKQGAVKRDTVARRKKKGFTWIGFIEVDLTARQKEELGAMELEAEYPLSGLATYVENGYKLSFGLDSDGVTYRAALTDVDQGSPTCGYTLTGRGGSVQKAYASLLYKHRDVLPDGWQIPTGSSAAPEFA